MGGGEVWVWSGWGYVSLLAIPAHFGTKGTWFQPLGNTKSCKNTQRDLHNRSKILVSIFPRYFFLREYCKHAQGQVLS